VSNQATELIVRCPINGFCVELDSAAKVFVLARITVSHDQVDQRSTLKSSPVANDTFLLFGQDSRPDGTKLRGEAQPVSGPIFGHENSVLAVKLDWHGFRFLGEGR
jgi:hypothetical protein